MAEVKEIDQSEFIELRYANDIIAYSVLQRWIRQGSIQYVDGTIINAPKEAEQHEPPVNKGRPPKNRRRYISINSLAARIFQDPSKRRIVKRIDGFIVDNSITDTDNTTSEHERCQSTLIADIYAAIVTTAEIEQALKNYTKRCRHVKHLLRLSSSSSPRRKKRRRREK